MSQQYKKRTSNRLNWMLMLVLTLPVVYHSFKISSDSIKLVNSVRNNDPIPTEAGTKFGPGSKYEQTNHCLDNETFSSNITLQSEIPRLNDLQRNNLCLSYKQQVKFFTMKDKLLHWSKQTNIIQSKESTPEKKPSNTSSYEHYLRPIIGHKFFALILNDKYAFRHIFKNGGTTVAMQTHSEKHRSRDEIGDRLLISTVRDPIDHFLSGWAECGSRLNLHETSMYGIKSNYPYDIRVRNYLNQTVTCRRYKNTLSVSEYLTLQRDETLFCDCTAHVIPQINFLLYNKDEIDSKVDIVGDTAELQGLLDLVGFKYDTEMKRGRDATDDDVKTKYFPNRRNELSRRTLLELCKFLVLDYFVFDFEPPSECLEQIASDSEYIMSFSSIIDEEKTEDGKLLKRKS